jgi:AcrR family transcriptional regulator
MNDTRRPYRSKVRHEQARATRRRIVDAAADLFVEHGYASTTIDAIAAKADVSRNTVFASVGGKAAVLKLAWDWTLAGDDEPVAIADRPETRRIMQGEDPATVLAGWMAMNARIAARLAPLHHVLTVAADADPEAASLLEAVERQRVQGAHDVVRRLAELGGLGPGLGTDQATAIADLLMDPLHHRCLVQRHGWAPEAYVAYLQQAARTALLA